MPLISRFFLVVLAFLWSSHSKNDAPHNTTSTQTQRLPRSPGEKNENEEHQKSHEKPAVQKPVVTITYVDTNHDDYPYAMRDPFLYLHINVTCARQYERQHPSNSVQLK